MWGWTELWASICPNELNKVANCVFGAHRSRVSSEKTFVIINTLLTKACVNSLFFHFQPHAICKEFFFFSINNFHIYYLYFMFSYVGNNELFSIRYSPKVLQPNTIEYKKKTHWNSFFIFTDLVSTWISLNFRHFCLTISIFMILCAGVVMHMGFFLVFIFVLERV